MDTKYWYEIDGKRIADETAMATKLLGDDVLFISDNPYADHKGVLQGKTLTLFVNCSDVFAWAYSDCEPITLDELPVLFDLYEKNPDCGAMQWVCIKRDQQPQLPVIDWLKSHNGWTQELDNLPKNKYDLFCQRQFNIKT